MAFLHVPLQCQKDLGPEGGKISPDLTTKVLLEAILLDHVIVCLQLPFIASTDASFPFMEALGSFLLK